MENQQPLAKSLVNDALRTMYAEPDQCSKVMTQEEIIEENYESEGTIQLFEVCEDPFNPYRIRKIISYKIRKIKTSKKVYRKPFQNENLNYSGRYNNN